MHDKPTEPKITPPNGPRDVDLITTRNLLASDDDLDRAYGEAYHERCYVVEGLVDGIEMTAVGKLDDAEAIEKEYDIDEIDISTLHIIDAFVLGARPGIGATRAERVRDGLRQVLE